jgi:hypothetical protein
MKKYLFVLFLFFAISGFSQNLVDNSDTYELFGTDSLGNDTRNGKYRERVHFNNGTWYDCHYTQTNDDGHTFAIREFKQGNEIVKSTHFCAKEKTSHVSKLR